MKHFILVICSFSSLFTQKSNIDQILISTKINGVSVKLGLDNPLDSEFVTAWFDSKTNWFYITAYQANGDKRTLEQTKIIEPIEKIEVFKSNESLQIGIKLAKELETFEKYHIVDPAEINFNLRFPVSEVILALEEERPTGKFRFKPKYYKLLETENLFYLSGSILMMSNFIAKKDPTLGFSIIAATFIYNQILIDNQ